MVTETPPNGDRSQFVRTTFDPDGADSLSVILAEAIARAEQVDVEDLELRLFDAVNPGALEQLFEPTDATSLTAEVRFQTSGHDVVVRNTGEVFVSPAD